MESQLTLFDVDETNWGLEEHIKQVGRNGVAQARAALRLAVVSSTRAERATTSGGGARGRTAA
jgi:hypothetical protein